MGEMEAVVGPVGHTIHRNAGLCDRTGHVHVVLCRRVRSHHVDLAHHAVGVLFAV